MHYVMFKCEKVMFYHLYDCVDLFGTGALLQTLEVLPSDGTLSLLEGEGVTCTRRHLRSKVT